MSYTTVTYHCEGCNCRFDTIAYNHHFAHDQCDWIDRKPMPLLTCDRHHDQCPMHDPEYRHQIGGWNSKQRKCRPIYVLRAGHTTDDNGNRVPATWLTLHQPDPPPERPNAPRPPAALHGRGYNPHARHLEPR